MHTVLDTSETSPHRRPRVPVQAVARTCGVLILLSLIAGGFGEGYVPSRIIVPDDPTATAHLIRAHGAMFRLGFAAYLVEAVCDIALALVFYVLLRPVRRNLALLAAFFGLVGTAVYAVAEVFYFGVSSIVVGADWSKAFPPSQLDTLALLWLKLFGYGGVVSVLFYGVATTIRGYLIFRSGFLPAWLGLLMVVGGVAFVARTFAFVLAPALPSSNLLFLMAPAGLALTVWLLAWGVNVAKWEAMANASQSVELPPRRGITDP